MHIRYIWIDIDIDIPLFWWGMCHKWSKCDKFTRVIGIRFLLLVRLLCHIYSSLSLPIPRTKTKTETIGLSRRTTVLPQWRSRTCICACSAQTSTCTLYIQRTIKELINDFCKTSGTTLLWRVWCEDFLLRNTF